MSIKDSIAAVIRSLTGAHIYRVMPRGLDLSHDLANGLPNLRVGLVFDIGANVGQSAQKYVGWFPSATVYSFEPVEQTFRQLRSNVRHLERVKCFRLAFGPAVGKGFMTTGERSDMNRLCQDGPGANEQVPVVTLDAFAASNGIGHIQYVKIDTEGGDLGVLEGGTTLLSRHRIDVVEVEAGLNPQNRTHVPLERVKAFLEMHGYLLFGVYEQVTEWPTREPQLRRANVTFISPRVIGSNRSLDSG